jgi:hypothetical protein
MYVGLAPGVSFSKQVLQPGMYVEYLCMWCDILEPILHTIVSYNCVLKTKKIFSSTLKNVLAFYKADAVRSCKFRSQRICSSEFYR